MTTENLYEISSNQTPLDDVRKIIIIRNTTGNLKIIRLVTCVQICDGTVV